MAQDVKKMSKTWAYQTLCEMLITLDAYCCKDLEYLKLKMFTHGLDKQYQKRKNPKNTLSQFSPAKATTTDHENKTKQFNGTTMVQSFPFLSFFRSVCLSVFSYLSFILSFFLSNFIFFLSDFFLSFFLSVFLAW